MNARSHEQSPVVGTNHGIAEASPVSSQMNLDTPVFKALGSPHSPWLIKNLKGKRDEDLNDRCPRESVIFTGPLLPSLGL